MEIKTLTWDSNYFGLNVVEISKLNDILYSPSKIISKLSDHNVDLAYCKSPKIIENTQNAQYHFQYVLKRLPLFQEIKENAPFHPKVSEYKKKGEVDRNLIKLAQLTGRVGRFGNDPNVSSRQCDEIFKSLIVNSIEGDLASDILVYRENEEIVGFCTIKIDDDEGYIPIIGVFPEYAGSGVGFSLMKAIETYLYNKGCKYAIGGTQDFNEQAIKAFVRFGMSLGEPEYVYHIWNKNRINYGK